MSGIFTGFSGGMSGGSSSSTAATTGAAFGKVILASTGLIGDSNASENETGAATADIGVTLKAAREGLLCSGAALASTTVCFASTGFSSAAVTLHSTGAGTNASPVLGFPCLPALTTLGVKRLAGLAAALPGEDARGDTKGDRGVVEVADLGEVGDEEEADMEERFLLPGTAFGAEGPWALWAPLPLGFAEPEAAWGA